MKIQLHLSAQTEQLFQQVEHLSNCMESSHKIIQVSFHLGYLLFLVFVQSNLECMS